MWHRRAAVDAVTACSRSRFARRLAAWLVAVAVGPRLRRRRRGWRHRDRAAQIGCRRAHRACPQRIVGDPKHGSRSRDSGNASSARRTGCHGRLRAGPMSPKPRQSAARRVRSCRVRRRRRLPSSLLLPLLRRSRDCATRSVSAFDSCRRESTSMASIRSTRADAGMPALLAAALVYATGCASRRTASRRCLGPGADWQPRGQHLRIMHELGMAMPEARPPRMVRGMAEYACRRSRSSTC